MSRRLAAFKRYSEHDLIVAKNSNDLNEAFSNGVDKPPNQAPRQGADQIFGLRSEDKA